MDNPIEHIRSIPARMLSALTWHGISLLQAPAVLQHFDLPVRSLADLADPLKLLEHLNPTALHGFARVHTTALRWLETGRGEVVDLSYLHFVPGVFVARAQEQAQQGVLQGIYLLAMHPYMSLTAFTPVWPVLQLTHPVLGPGFPVYELWPLQHWHLEDERRAVKGAFRALYRRFAHTRLTPQGVLLDGSISGLCFEGYLHPAYALTEYRTAEWNLAEALTPRPEPGEWEPDDI
jgi:hypothetical protein